MGNNVIQPEGNYFDKYNSKNPIVKWMMRNFFDDLEGLLCRTENIESILEAGCGEGDVTSYLEQVFGLQCKITAFDISAKVVEEAKSKCKSVVISTGNIYKIEGDSKYDLVCCCEVLEHLEEPEKALQELLRVSNRYLLVSVPREPIWRLLNMARGKYIGDFGNTPGHIQHWSSKRFRTFLEVSGMEIVEMRKPLPWTMVLLQKK